MAQRGYRSPRRGDRGVRGAFSARGHAHRNGYDKPASTRYNGSWRTWPELGIRIRQLPQDIDTFDIYQFMSSKGQIVRIDIRDDRRLMAGASCATLTFRPPPRREIWLPSEQPMSFSDGSSILVKFELLDRPPTFYASPVHPERTFPERMEVKAMALDFGFMHTPDHLMAMQSLSTASGNDVTFNVNVRRKEIHVSFTLDAGGDDEIDTASSTESFSSGASGNHDPALKNVYRFCIPFHQIQKCSRRRLDAGGYEIFIPARIPPKFYRKRSNLLETHQSDGKDWNLDVHAWYRQTDFVRDRNALKNTPLSLRRATPIIDIGRWTTYRVEFDSSVVNSFTWHQLSQALIDHNAGFSRAESLIAIQPNDSGFWDAFDYPHDPIGSISALLMRLDVGNSNPSVHLPFEVQYQLEVCISQGFLHESNMDPDFLRRLAMLPTNEALRRLEHVADKAQRIYKPAAVFDMIIPRSSNTMSNTKNLPPHCIWQRTATVTPTTVYYSSPSVEVTNRIVRQYREYANRFLRVRFSDERQEGRIFAGDNDSQDPLFTRVKRCLTNGITIGANHYEFLASGNSQFREHGAYFFASTPDLSAADIRTSMGDFSDIKVIAKYASRVGQCFSTTYPITRVKVEIKEIEDVERNGYNFTDGVGCISPFLANMIASELPHSPKSIPSLFQFRLGGSKGVLAVKPGIGPKEVHIRRSQYKFDTPDFNNQHLEIIRCSSFTSAQLNRQLINILSCLGVSHHVFVDKLSRQLAKMSRAMRVEETALELLQSRIDPNHSTVMIAAMIEDGFMRQKEPFLNSLMRLWHSWTLKALKEKASLDVEQGAFVLGCVDEYAVLKGHYEVFAERAKFDEAALPEIFLQISDDDRHLNQVITGICIVARNPSLHPGDVRVVRAIDDRRLHHHKNVVVFPQQGDRDIPNMCSGGDLDGDDFFVSWDKALIPPEWNHDPMNYTGPEPIKVRDVTINDITSFFVNYMKMDSLGRIANAHLANADLASDNPDRPGAKSPKCLELAHLHSVAVDFPKTGQPARMSKWLRPERYPHFMSSNRHPRNRDYHSHTVLGQLYDNVEPKEFKPLLDEPFDPRILNAFEVDDKTIETASGIKEQYDSAMRRTMAQYEIKSEFEVFTAFVLEHSGLSNNYKLHEELGRVSGALKDRFVDICQKAAGGDDFKTMAPFIAAMYIATARQVKHDLEAFSGAHEGSFEQMPEMQPPERPLMSFPWLFQRELGKIARTNEDQHGRSGETAYRRGRAEDLFAPMEDSSFGSKVSHLGYHEHDLLGLDLSNSNHTAGTAPILETIALPSDDAKRRQDEQQVSSNAELLSSLEFSNALRPAEEPAAYASRPPSGNTNSEKPSDWLRDGGNAKIGTQSQENSLVRQKENLQNDQDEEVGVEEVDLEEADTVSVSTVEVSAADKLQEFLDG